MAKQQFPTASRCSQLTRISHLHPLGRGSGTGVLDHDNVSCWPIWQGRCRCLCRDIRSSIAKIEFPGNTSTTEATSATDPSATTNQHPVIQRRLLVILAVTVPSTQEFCEEPTVQQTVVPVCTATGGLSVMKLCGTARAVSDRSTNIDFLLLDLPWNETKTNRRQTTGHLETS
jgi:hypothetical protein